MSKIKKGTIFKICIVSLLIILSTIGFVLSSVKIEQIAINDADDNEYDVYKWSFDIGADTAASVKNHMSYANSTESLKGLNSLFSQLAGNRDVLCSQHHFPLNDAGGYYAETEYIKGSPAQSYILAQLENQYGGYYENDPVQNAWWSLIYQLGVSGDFLNNLTNNNEFSLSLADATPEAQSWLESGLLVPVDNSYAQTIDELKSSINTYVEEKFNIKTEDIKGNFDNTGFGNSSGNNASNGAYNIIVDLINAFSRSDQFYNSGFYNENNQVDTNDIIYAINTYSKFMNAIKAENPDGNYYTADAFRNYFGALQSDEDEVAKIKNKISYGIGAGKSVYVVDEKGNKWVQDVDKINPIFGYKGKLAINYSRRPLAYERLMSRGLTEEQLANLFAYIIEQYSSYQFIGSDYDITAQNSLVDRAKAYEEFYETLKENSEISIDTSGMNVNESIELNAFVVGPFVLDYVYGASESELFGGISEFILETDTHTFGNEQQIKFGSDKVDNEGKLITNLSNGEFALVTSVVKQADDGSQSDIGTTYKVCGNSNYAYPQPGEPFYIVFNAGAGDTQITNIGYKYDYLCHKSEYMYYELWYNGVDMQDLAEIYNASLWYQRQEINFEIPIQQTIELKKMIPGDYPVSDSFNFDIYVEIKEGEEVPDNGHRTFEHNGVKYKYHTEANVSANGEPVVVTLPSYYKSEGEPKVIAIEKDKKGNYFINEDSWKYTDSIWHNYKPIIVDENGQYVIGTGIFECLNGLITATNKIEEKSYPIEIEKIMKENPDGDTFYAKLGIGIKGERRKHYMIPLKPDGNSATYSIYKSQEPDANGYYICYTENIEGTEEFGTIVTGTNEDGYVYAKWSYTFNTYSSGDFSYFVTEVDSNYLDYYSGNNTDSSIWNKYQKPVYYNRASVMEEGDVSYVEIENRIKDQSLPIKLELSKQVQNTEGEPLEDNGEFVFDVIVRKDDKDGNSTTEKFWQSIFVPVTNPGEDLKVTKLEYTIQQINKDSTYTIIVDERDSAGYEWTQIVQNLQQDGWQIETDENGNILYVYYQLDNNMTEFSASFTNINTKLEDKHNKFKITKTIKDEEGNDLTDEEIAEYFEKNPEGFTFRVETIRGKELAKSDFSESLQEYISEHNGNIYITINAENYADGVVTNEIYWGIEGVAPVYEIYEVDEHDYTYLQYIEMGQNRPLESIWGEFTPNDGGHWTIDFVTQDTEVIVDAINRAGTVEKQFSITKEVDGTWANEDEFYFRILSLDGNKTNIVEEYFEEEYLTTLKNGLKVVKITKHNPTVTSKILTISTLDELPKFWVTEVDQYGNAWSETLEKEDSLWNHYTPEHYGTWTCGFTIFEEVLDLEITAKNTSNKFTLSKEIVTNGEYTTAQFFEEYPTAEFYFRLWDSEGYVVTKKYFDTTSIKTYNGETVDAIVINKDNYTGIESLPIATSAGDRFTLQEVFKTKEDKNLYENTDEQLSWIIDFKQNNNVEIVAENIAQMILKIDKVVEGAPDNFLPEEEFHFKVFENDTDVTNDLFGTDVITINQAVHQNGGATSRVIYGNHTYEIVEYDAVENGKTYLEGKETSDFWKKFTPTNNGVWEVSLGDTKGPSFVEAVNYLTTSIKIVKETEGDKNQEFGVSLVIWPSEGTNWMMVDGNYYPTKTSSYYYNHAIKVSANKSYTLDGIYWSGEAPTFQVVEQAATLPSNWILEGYKVNEQVHENPPVLQLVGGEENRLVIVNNQDDEVKIPVSKTIVDQNGIPTTSETDQTFYFDIYVEPIENAEYKGNVLTAISSQEGYVAGNYSENGKYVRIETLAVTIPAGSTNANKITDIITIPEGTELDYKVVEVDAPQNGVTFKDYDSESNPNSNWNKFEPTMFSNGKWGNREGIWTGILNKKNSGAKVDAYNKVTKVTIDFEKWVWFENKLQPIEEREVFKFIAEYTSSLGRDFETEIIEITPDNLKVSKTFELLRGEIITYKITEVDPVENTAYDADNLTKFWKQFTPADDPADGLGIITGTVDGSSANISLTGKNIKNVHSWLAIVKEKSDWLEHEKFYFEVYEGENNVTETLFDSENIVEVNGKKVIELNYNRREVFSNEQIWKSGTTAPTYTVKEVEYNSEIYTPVNETVTKTLPAVDIDTTLTIENAATVTGYAGFINEEIDYDRFEIKKVVENSQGSISYTDTFYAIVLDKDNNNVTESLFTGEGASATIETLNKTIEGGSKEEIKAVKLTESLTAITKYIPVKGDGSSYKVVEVDVNGYTFDEKDLTNNKESVWNKGYEPENDTGIYNVTLVSQENKSNIVTSLVTMTNLIDDEPINYTLTKVVKVTEGETEKDITTNVFEEREHFYFKITDSDGKDVIDTLFKDVNTITIKDENDNEYKLLDLSQDQKFVTTEDIINSSETFTVTETDQYGVSYGEYTKPEDKPEKGWSVWEEYKPSDGKGIWNLNKEQTSIIAENKTKTRTAHIKLSKQTTYNWADGIEYNFNVYIKSAQSEEDSTPISVTLNNENTTWDKDISWNIEEGTPSVKIEETNLPEGVELLIKVGEQTLQSGEYYKLSNKDDVNYTFDCTNIGKDESASFKLLKSALNSETYTFEYEYGYYEDGNWVAIPNTADELKVIANSEVPAISNTYTWENGEQAPMFRVWETSGKLESISATNAGETSEIEVDGHKGIQGTLNSNAEVTVMATNGPEHKGKLKVVKTFDVDKDNLLADLQWLASEYEAKGLDLDDITFTFNVSISYGTDKESRFLVNGEEKNEWNTTKVWTLPMFIDTFEADSSDNTVTIIDGIEVEWSGSAPQYTVDEIIYSNSFWEPESKVNCSGELQCACSDETNCSDEGVEAKCIVAEIINRYDFITTQKYNLLTSLAGDVWIENPLEGKTVEIDGIRYINPEDVASDIFASDVYVIPYRCVVDKDGNIIESVTNTSAKFILSYRGDYKYLTEADLGHWEFSEVVAPAFNLEDPAQKAQYDAGCTVKYYVDFYYDGMKYEPTDVLVGGSAEDYLALNDDYDKYFDNSVAIESDSERKTYNSTFATVEGNDLYSNGTSTGIITDKNGNKTADIDYTTEITGTIDGSEIIRTTSTGTVNMPISETSSIDEIKANYMRASTENLGLRYFFKDLAIGDNDWTLLDVHRSLYTEGERELMMYEYEYATDFVSEDYAQHINLGLIEREKADVSIDKKIESVTIIINEKALTYNFDNDGKVIENLQDAIARFTRTVEKDDELYLMINNDYFEESNEFNIYTSDYFYRSDVYEGTEVKEAYDSFMSALFGETYLDAIKTKELQMFLTYSVTLSNNSGIYDVRINSIADYYDSSLTYIDVAKGYEAYVSSEQIGSETDEGPGIWAYIEQDEKEHLRLTNIFANRPKYYNDIFKTAQITSKEELVNANYKKMVMSAIDTEENDIRVNANSSTTYYLTYRADKADDLDNGIILGAKNNIAEITSFTAFMPDTEYKDYAAVIDKDSAPGNYNINDELSRNVMEDDTDFANVKVKIENDTDIRSISGTAWVDKEIEENNKDGQILGNSIKDENDYLISGLTTKLVEVIDLPVVNEEGEITDQYIEYEFYWKGAETTTNDDGTYLIDSYVPVSAGYGSVERPGLVAGNYVVRFFYGDKDTTAYDNSGAEVEIQINGEDYKSTAYQIDQHNEGYIDNEWHDLFTERYDDDGNRIADNDARDNEARRLNIISRTQELSNSNTAIFEVANYKDAEEYADAKTSEYNVIMGGNLPDSTLEAKRIEFAADYESYKAMLYGNISYDNGNVAYSGIINSEDYKMFADTAKLNLKVEYYQVVEGDLNSVPGVNITEYQNGDTSRYKYSIENINLGLEERSKTNIYLDKQIKEITLTTSSDKEFFHVEYDILYSTNPGVLETGWNKVTDGLYVKLVVNEDTLIGENNLQKLDDEFEDVITQGFRYINIDSTVLQGLKLDIKYEITAINLSETDKYGIGLENIMNGNQTFKDAIDALSSPVYVIIGDNESLLFEDYDGDGAVESAKAYGQYLGHTYYQGFGVDNNDVVVTTTVRKVVDYIDNDIEADLAKLNENGSMWEAVENSNGSEALGNLVDKDVFVDGEIQDPAENPYKTILVSADSKEANSEFVKELKPIAVFDGELTIEDNDKNEVLNPIATATIGISTAKIFAGTDEGRTGMDNFAEILMIENTVGRRDIETVYGNFDPRGGAEQTTERDETATEIVTLSPPTGNLENDRMMTIVIASICGVAILAGAGVGIKLKISGKSKKSEKTEE